jgi:two-component system, OmpR family, phosphate regulon sensor histidine kinase PhoR
VSVSDRGMGIDPVDLARIFDHFYRSANPAVRRRKGTGIGLSIVRYIVEAHGGTITVDSTPGKGTTFTFTLPLENPEEPTY